ncbi:hypothetical protein HDU85_005254 [Gaertneriomyces sp. JEL0708]|nr:hypothetical protein HDU85_005254 [Gaertneriomyces sp. JEL0708]
MSSNRGFASMDSEKQHDIAQQGANASAQSRAVPVEQADPNATYTQPGNTEETGYSSPAQNTRSKVDMTDKEPPVSQSATSKDDVITYEGRQGFATLKEKDPEYQKELASRGGNMTTK